MLSILFLFSCYLTATFSYEIVVFPMTTKSQLLAGSRIGNYLHQAGHRVTLVAGANDAEDLPTSSNYETLFFPTLMSHEEDVNALRPMELQPETLLLETTTLGIGHVFLDRCRGFLGNEELKKQILGLRPDVAIVTSFLPCYAQFLIENDIPFLDFCTPPFHDTCNKPHGIPYNPSFMVDFEGSFGLDDLTTFTERFTNAVLTFVGNGIVWDRFYGAEERFVNDYQRQRGREILSLDELRSRASFVLINGNPIFQPVSPIFPKFIYIGGIQCHTPRPLKELDVGLADFVETAEEDVVVFSLGGVLDTSTLPKNFIEETLDILGTLPAKFVWKLNQADKNLANRVPKNVKISKWLPQQDLLGHPKTKLFMSHGGIQGCFESICHGKPVLGFPMFGDQITNIRRLAKKGMAIEFDPKSFNASLLRENVATMLRDPRYAEAATEMKDRFWDAPQTPVERLVFATEYTVRHKGARHLTSEAALKVTWVRRNLLDVFAVLTIVIVVILVSIVVVLRKCFKLCFGGSGSRVKED